MANLFENEVQIKTLNDKTEEELIYPKTKANLIQDLNTFSAIKIGDSGITALGYNSILELISGEGIEVTFNNISKVIKIAMDLKNIYTKEEIDNLIRNNSNVIFGNYIFDSTIDLAHVLSE